MSDTVISVENLSKYYRLGLISGGTLRDDLARKWAKFRGKPDPLLIIGQEDHDNVEDEFIWALRNINFEVKQGEILGIIGKNGAGKTTLLKILGKITAPTEGRAILNGRLGCLIAVGTGFHPELTGRENIYLNGAILGMKKHEVKRKYDEIVDFSGVEKFIDTPIKRYSSGMNVRLGFAVAAHLDPEILLIDEVLAVGDADFQSKCLGKMDEVARGGRTVLFVSHNMASIKQLCSSAILLENGKITMRGDAHNIVNHYLSTSSVDGDILSPTVELVKHKNSQGPTKGLLLWAQLLNSNREPCIKFHIGDDIIIVACIQNNFKSAARKVGLEFQISTSDNLPISLIKKVDFNNYKFKESQSNMVISAKLIDLRFLQGEYKINIRARNDYGDEFELIENCLSFEVISGGKVEKTGTSEKRKFALVHISTEWKIEDISSPIESIKNRAAN